MSFKLYNRPFKIGVLLTVLVFVVANIVSYVSSARGEKIRFADAEAVWGFPYPWVNDPSGLTQAINLACMGVVAFVVGFLFRYLFTPSQK